MARKLAVPSVAALNTEGVPFSTVVFLQATEDSFKTLDDNVVYKDGITVRVPDVTIKAKTAQGQGFSIDGVVVASGEDYNALVSNFETLLQSHNALRQVVADLVEQLKGN